MNVGAILSRLVGARDGAAANAEGAQAPQGGPPAVPGFAGLLALMAARGSDPGWGELAAGGAEGKPPGGTDPPMSEEELEALLMRLIGQGQGEVRLDRLTGAGHPERQEGDVPPAPAGAADGREDEDGAVPLLMALAVGAVLPQAEDEAARPVLPAAARGDEGRADAGSHAVPRGGTLPAQAAGVAYEKVASAGISIVYGDEVPPGGEVPGIIAGEVVRRTPDGEVPGQQVRENGARGLGVAAEAGSSPVKSGLRTDRPGEGEHHGLADAPGLDVATAAGRSPVRSGAAVDGAQGTEPAAGEGSDTPVGRNDVATVPDTPGTSVEGAGRLDGTPAPAVNGAAGAAPADRAEAPAPARDRDPAAEIRRVVDQVVEAVDILAREEGHEVRLRLRPPELGEVRIRMDVRGNTVHLSMAAEHDHVTEMLRGNLQDLRTALADRQIQMSRAEVWTGTSGQTPWEGQGRGYGQPGDRPPYAGAPWTDGDAPQGRGPRPSPRGRSGDGRVDYRV